MSELLYPQKVPETIQLSCVSNSGIDVKEYMKHCNVLFLGCCRNVGTYLPTLLNHIHDCGSKFNSYRLLIYENDSNDNTRQILLDNVKENYIYIFEDKVKIYSRTKRLERGRNALLNKARKLNSQKDYQYFIVLDMDDVNSTGEFVNTIETCFLFHDWDVLCANQKKRYYDLWALRKKNDCEIDIWLTGHGEMDIVYEEGYLLEVDSAFGGIAIYRFSDILNDCYYIGTQLTERGIMEKCEHVDFHRSIKMKGGKIYINTSFFNS